MKLRIYTIGIITCILFTTNIYAGREKTKKSNIVTSTLGIATNFLADTFQDLSIAEWSIYLKEKPNDELQNQDDEFQKVYLDPQINLNSVKTVPELSKDEWNTYLKKNTEEQSCDLLY